MLKYRRSTWWIVFWGTTFGLVLGVPSALIPAQSFAADDKPAVLFQDLNDQDMQLSEKQERVLQAIKADKTTASTNLVKVNAGVFAAPDLEMNLVADQPVRASRTAARTEGEKVFWAGKVHATPQDVLLVNRGGNVTGTIHTQKELYLVRPLGGGLHVLIKQDPSKMPEEHPPGFENKAIQEGAPRLNLADAAPPPSSQTADQPPAAPPVLKVLVAYTKAVDDLNGDIEGLIDLAALESNQIYQNSKVNLTLQVAKTLKVDYVESGSFETDVSRLAGKTDGFMDDIHSLRDSAGADVVVLLINNTQFCGLADAILANANTAFACVHHGCATGYYSFAHEIGHLQGARHDPDNDSTSTPFAFGHGLQRVGQHDRTVMAYDKPGAMLTRISYFSNPDVTVNGESMGSTNKHNNARVLNSTAATITGFRP